MASTPSPLPPTSPSRNPYLSAEKYGTTHFDPAQTDTTPVTAPRGMFRIDLRTCPRIAGGPVGYMQLASTSPRYMWGTSTGAISYLDLGDGGLRAVAQLAVPGAVVVPPDKLDRVLGQRFTAVSQVEHAVKELGVDWTRLATNIYMFVDKDNVLYANTANGVVNAYGLVDPATPSAGIKVLRTLDLSRILANLGSAIKRYDARIVGLNLTYDGKLAILTSRSVIVVDRSFVGDRHTIELGADELVSNAMAVDERGGIYVASDTMMHKLVWTGTRLSSEERDGAWSSPYDFGREPPSVKLGRGTGSTPTLMGFGDDPDKLVVITDGADRMKVVAFWRDAIPVDFTQQAGTKSRRIAGQIGITCGLAPQPEFIQSEQSVVVNGYGAFVVNNIRPQGAKDRLVDVLAGGPVFPPPAGVERVEWDPTKRQWRPLWTRNDVVATSMVPVMSSTANVVFVNGYTRSDGWELTGMDWHTGKTVHRTIFGPDTLGNGAYALIQFIDDGDLLFNSIGGAIRVQLTDNAVRGRD